jgi:two-component system response regulator YesN
MARVVNTSAAYLSRRFMQAIGVSFVDYIGRVRVEKARRLLQDPSLRISMIALEVGFRSLSQFNRTFRRVTGRAPRELRIP